MRASSLRGLGLLLVALGAATLPFAPGVSRSEGLTLCIVTISYVAALVLIDSLSARMPEFPAPLVRPFVGVIAVVAVMVAIPRVAVAGALLLLVGAAFYTWANGLALGLWLSAAVVAGALLADGLAPTHDQVDEFTLLAYALVVPGIVVIVDRLTSDHRRTTAALAQLHDTLDRVVAQPDLATTLDSIAMSVAHGVDATVACVIVPDDEGVAIAFQTAVESDLTSHQVERFTQDELTLGYDSPLGRALTDDETVVIDDVADERRYPPSLHPWTVTLRELGCHSIVLVPLRAGDDIVGALAAAFPWTGRPDDDDLNFLEAYADRAGAVVVRARSYEEERAASAELAEIDRQKSEFLALVSNELRTPLTAVRRYVETVIADWDRLPDAERRGLLAAASSNADELTRLVGQLLDFARTDAGVIDIVPQPLEVRAAVTFALEDLGPVVADHYIEVDVPERLAVLADATGFDHVLKNIVTNAVQYSPAGSGVVVRASSQNGEVVISVADEGIGITPAEQERVFDRFYRSGDSRDRRSGGGIGLTIARRFTEMHGGRIWVESTPGRGSTFSFSLPVTELVGDAGAVS